MNRFRHQAVAADSLCRFRVPARAFDGSVEAIESTDPGRSTTPGVQFHPERMDELAPRFFSAPVSAADSRR